VLFVPSFFAVLQGFEERRKAKRSNGDYAISQKR
jgi:hypothetical protein